MIGLFEEALGHSWAWWIFKWPGIRRKIIIAHKRNQDGAAVKLLDITFPADHGFTRDMQRSFCRSVVRRIVKKHGGA